jgi:hypothetical protein
MGARFSPASITIRDANRVLIHSFTPLYRPKLSPFILKGRLSPSRDLSFCHVRLAFRAIVAVWKFDTPFKTNKITVRTRKVTILIITLIYRTILAKGPDSKGDSWGNIRDKGKQSQPSWIRWPFVSTGCSVLFVEFRGFQVG